MRVLFLTSTLPRFAGDLQANFVGEQAAAWKTARPDDEIFILAPHDRAAPLRETRDGIEIVRFRYMVPVGLQALAYPAILPNLKRRPWLAVQVLPFLLSEYRAASRMVAEHKIDLVYAHWVMPQGLIAMWLNRTKRVPYVLQNHSSDLRVFGKLGHVGNGLARQVIRSARHLFCVNSAQRDHTLGLFSASEASDVATKVSILPMGVQPPPAQSSISSRYEFGSISRLSKKKGLHHLLMAAERLAETGFRPAIGIAGDGEDAAELKAMVRSADVDFPGFLTGVQKERFFEQTRVFVVPSAASGDDVEGMPVALLEALCRGKPTIASRDTNIASLPEWDKIKNDVIYLDDPTDIEAFAAALRHGAAPHADSEQRLRTVMSRYWWPNLIREYLRTIGLGSEKRP